MDRTPKDASVLFAQLRLPANDSQIVATQLWELDELGQPLPRPDPRSAQRHPSRPATLPIYEAI